MGRPPPGFRGPAAGREMGRSQGAAGIGYRKTYYKCHKKQTNFLQNQKRRAIIFYTA
jgi:hypothetical protein